jgi:hypothetical protein
LPAPSPRACYRGRRERHLRRPARSRPSTSCGSAISAIHPLANTRSRAASPGRRSNSVNAAPRPRRGPRRDQDHRGSCVPRRTSNPNSVELSTRCHRVARAEQGGNAQPIHGRCRGDAQPIHGRCRGSATDHPRATPSFLVESPGDRPPGTLPTPGDTIPVSDRRARGWRRPAATAAQAIRKLISWTFAAVSPVGSARSRTRDLCALGQRAKATARDRGLMETGPCQSHLG